MPTNQDSPNDRAARASELRVRSRTAAIDLLKTVVSLSTGAIAVIFAMLTDKDTIVKPGPQAWTILLAVMFFVLAVLAGLYGWLANSQRYYQESEYVRKGESSHRLRGERLKALQLAGFFTLSIFFSLGVVFAGLYIFLRTLCP